MKASPFVLRVRRKSVGDALSSCAEAVDRLRELAVPQLAPATTHALRQLIDVAGAMLGSMAGIPMHTAEAWLAVMNFEKAVSTLQAVATAPEAWAGLPWLFQAQHLLGVASVHQLQALRLAAQRTKGGRQKRVPRNPRPASTASRVRQALRERPELDDKRVAQLLELDDVGYVGKVRRRLKKPPMN